MSQLREECGVFGIFASERKDLARLTYYGLFALQHRGQESCGIVVNDDGIFSDFKDTGLVQDVFDNETLEKLGNGNMAIGHVRYGTTGSNDRSNAQPIVVNHHKGRMALAHNGNLVNSYELRQALEEEGSIFHTTSDTEVISYVITKERVKTTSIEEAISNAMEKLDGAYSLVVMSPSKLIALRDKRGYRPLCYGVREDGSYVVASETCALDAVGAKFVRDIEPGEILIFSEEGIKSITTQCEKEEEQLCIFEYIYFARPDSVIGGISVHEARKRAGVCLALEHPRDADVVIGVPDSGLDAALGYSQQSGIPYGIGFIKNKYVARTFIAPGQKAREDKVRIKLNVLSATVKGKRVVLVDDSIVRGTTSARIVKQLREAGAKEVHVMSAAPPFIAPCYYGTDVDSKENLIACKYTIDEITEKIGADSLGYLGLNALKTLICKSNDKGFCRGCFTGGYATAIPEKSNKDRFDKRISEK
ncbi:amidophosphoribosyltransferase [Eubacteriales bacterium KG127]